MAETRPQALAKIQAALKRRFPAATITTNADMNPATPMAVTAAWGHGKIVKAVRADGINVSPDDFLAKAVPVLEKFQASNVPSLLQAHA